MSVETDFEGESGITAGDRVRSRELALVGRERELGAIREARAGDVGCGIVIVGAPGVGKTRLAREALSEASDAGAEVVWVRATASAATIPLAAVIDLLPPGRRAGDPLRVFQAGAELLLARADGRPLILGVDDAHLLDAGSAAFVLHLAGKGAFVVATVRAGTQPPDAVTALWKDEGARRLELGSLDEDGTVRLVTALLDGPVEGVAAYWAHTASAGNPLYLCELVAGAVDAGTLEHDAELWRLRRRQPLGPALTELVAQRLAGLGQASRLLLAAVGIGEPLAADIAAAVGDADSLAVLESRGLLVVEAVGEERMVRLGHPLYGEVARREIPEARVDDLRIRLSDAVRATGLAPGDALRVAIWLRDAGARVDPDLLLAASTEAYQARDPALALELALAAEGGHEATLARGQALAALGRHEEAERELARLEGSLPSPQAAVGYLFARINVLVWGLGRAADARRLVERAEAWWGDAAWRQQTAGLRLMVLSATGELDEAIALADELAVEPRLEPMASGLLATSGAIAWLHGGRTATAQAATAGALPAAPADERLGDRELAGLVSWSLARLEAGREWDVVEDRVSRIERAAVRRGDRITAGPAVGLLGHLALARGQPRTAIRLLREAVGHLEAHDPRGLSVVIVSQIAIGFGLLGDTESARAAAADTRQRLGGRAPAWHERGLLARADAWAAAAGGESTRAADALIEAAAAMDAWPLFQAQVLYDALSMSAPVAAVAGALEMASERTDAPLVQTYARHAGALASEDAAALEQAARELATIGAELAAAEAYAAAAQSYDAASQPAAARRAAARGGRAIASCEGASTPALRAIRIGDPELTRRERELAEMAARGLGNAEIAELLTISVRTAESHIYHAMTKLGVRTREELAAALEARQVLAPD